MFDAMKASELIEELKKKMERWGDVEVFHDTTMDTIECVTGYPGFNEMEPIITIK